MTGAGWVFLGVFVLLVIGGAVYVVSSDRKRSPLKASDQDLQSAFTVISDSQHPVEAASSAIRKTGGEAVSTSEDGFRVVGWIGNTWTNIPTRQAYQLLIDIRPAQGGYEFRCLARPRFSSSFGGAARASDLGRRLSEQKTDVDSAQSG